MGAKSSDQLLVERVQQGDRSAFDILVVKYQHKVVKLVMRYVRDQAEALDVMLKDKGKTLDAVVQLEVDDAILLSRIEKRASETAGGPRADDNADALKKRLDVYHAQTAPLIEYYSAKGNLRSVDGMADMDDVTRQIMEVLEG